MTTEEARAESEEIARSHGATVIELKALPAGPGVLPGEVGEPGPWLGYRLADGTEYGWARAPFVPRFPTAAEVAELRWLEERAAR